LLEQKQTESCENWSLN